VPRKDFFAGVFLLTLMLPLSLLAQPRYDFSTGLHVGFARLEGDVKKPNLSPYLSGTLRIIPTPFFSLGAEVGFSSLGQSDRPKLQSSIIPFEVDARVNFFPFWSVRPFALVGGGGVYWKASENGQVVVLDGRKQQGLDSFLKTGGGLEFRISERLGLEVGGVFRYSLTDALDQRFSGDEKDQVLSAFVGLSYRLTPRRDDRDRDGVPDDLDLAVEVAEDPDGYLDHDGVPEEGPEGQLPVMGNTNASESNGSSVPIVIHHPLRRAEAGHPLKLVADIYSSNPLRRTSVLYRRLGEADWSVVELEQLEGNRYQGIVPASSVTVPALEYAIVSLGEDLRSVGYAGLPKRPNRVQIYGGGGVWRFVGGVVSAFGWGTATYLVLRKQQ
jgi:hypothetical protein